MSAQLTTAVAGAAAGDGVRRNWLAAGLPLAVGLAALAVTYAPEIAAAVRVWVESTTFNHCFLVLPVAAYLLYTRWDAAAASAPRASPWIAAAAVPVVLGWFVAERTGIMEARQLLAMVLVQIMVIAALGPRTWWALSAPLLYLFFLVPMGEYTTPWLQAFTARFIVVGLDLLRIPNFADGIAIEIPEGRFLVAEACAGLRFLIASVAFGVFYACVVYVSPMRRLVFIALSIVVPVIANGFRALGIVVLGHVLGGAEAAAADHLLYGWIFFAIVTLVLILAGLPFRQLPPALRPVDRTPRAARAGGAAIAVVAVTLAAVLPRLAANGLDAAPVTGPSEARLELPLTPPARCSPEDGAAAGLPLSTIADLPDAALSRSYRCADGTLVLRIIVFPAKIGADPVFAALQGSSIVPGWSEVAANVLRLGDRESAQTWRVTDLERQGRFATVAAALWIDGGPSPGGIAGRVRQASSVLRGDAVPPVVAIVVSDAHGDRERPHRAIERFLRDANGLSSPLVRVPSGAPAAAATAR